MVLAWLVYGCLRLSRNAQILMATVWSVPRDELPTFGRWLPRALAFLAVLGVGFVAGGAISGIGTFGGLGPASALVGFAGSLVVNVAMFWAGFTVVLSVGRRGGSMWRGALIAGIGWTLLQFVDTLLVSHELRHYRTLYGAFATVIVLVWWIGLGTLLTAFAAELDVVVQRAAVAPLATPETGRGRGLTRGPTRSGSGGSALDGHRSGRLSVGGGRLRRLGAGRGPAGRVITSPSMPPASTTIEAMRKARENPRSGLRPALPAGRVGRGGQERRGVATRPRVVRAARPTEAPIWRLQLTRPEARPASWWGTPPVASRAIGVKARPMPKVARMPPPQAPVQ